MPSDCRSCQNECRDCRACFTQLHDRVDEARDLFDKYASHLGHCDTIIGSSRPCTCGYESACKSLGLTPDGQ